MPFAGGILTPKALYRGQLPSSVGILYTAPATNTGCFAIIKEFWVCNTDTVARTFTLYVVEAGGSVADDRAICKDVTIAAKTVYSLPATIVLNSSLVSTTL